MKSLINYIKYFKEFGVDDYDYLLTQLQDDGNKQLYVNKQLQHINNEQNEVMDLFDNQKNIKQVANQYDSRLLADETGSLEDLEKMVKSYDGCDLKKTAQKTVFGDGNASASVMFIGEAPGATEDAQGIPFCGQSGKLLDNIVKSIGLVRSDIYITNTVYWRPPANRRPTAKEIAICRPFVEKHIALINPKVIVLVGSTAVESLLSSQTSMHELRENFFDYSNKYLDHSIKTMVIFHPSYLLRQPYKKKLMWYDMLRLKENL